MVFTASAYRVSQVYRSETDTSSSRRQVPGFRGSPQMALREDLGRRQLDIGKRLERQRRPAGNAGDVTIALGARLPVDVDGLCGRVDHPVFGDAGLGVESQLGRSIVGE